MNFARRRAIIACISVVLMLIGLANLLTGGKGAGMLMWGLLTAFALAGFVSWFASRKARNPLIGHLLLILFALLSTCTFLINWLVLG